MSTNHPPRVEGHGDGARAICPPNARTEQLRKLDKLKCYYLDQFNQKESSYATGNGCKTALQLELRRWGSLLPGFLFLGNVQITWVTPSICIIQIKNTPVSTLYPRCCIVVAWPLLLRKGGMPLKLLGLPAAGTPVVLSPFMSAHQSCTPVGIDYPLTGPRNPVLADDQSL
jgi:hypothetical protein